MPAWLVQGDVVGGEGRGEGLAEGLHLPDLTSRSAHKLPAH